MILHRGNGITMIYHIKEQPFDLQTGYTTFWPVLKLIMLYSMFLMLTLHLFAQIVLLPG